MTRDEVKELGSHYDMLQGCINRLHVSDDKEELARLYTGAIYHIGNILRLRVGGNYKEINFGAYSIDESVGNLRQCVTKEYAVGYGINLLGRLSGLHSDRVKELDIKE